MVDIIGFYNSLLSATLGGVPFAVDETDSGDGRRVPRFLFPGVDGAGFQDLGDDPGPITIRGLLTGVNYIGQMQALQTVFQSPGPYQLVHPWFGTMQVVLVDGQKPRFTLSSRQLQVCRFVVQLYRYNPQPAQRGLLDTLTKLGVKLDALTADAENWLAGAMTPLVGAATAFSYIQSWLTNAVGVFAGVVSLTSSADAIAPAVAGDLSALTTLLTGGSNSFLGTSAGALTFPVAAAAGVTSLMGTWSGAATPAVPSAVAPGGITIAAPAADAADVVATLLAAVPGIQALGRGPAPASTLAGATLAIIAGAAVQAATNIDYPSQQDALAQQASLFAVLDTAISAAATAAATDPLNAPPVWIDLVSVKGALASDMSALIGRLPAVVTINTPAPMPVWLFAQYVSGDTPSNVFATWQDVIARNGVRHPAMMPAAPIEVLNQ